MTVLPVDMKAVAAYGMAEWSRDSFWPVQYAEIRAINLSVIAALEGAAGKVDEAWADCLWSDTRYSDHLTQRLHAALVSTRAQRSGLSLSALGDAAHLYQPDYERSANEFRRLMRYSPRNGTALRDVRRRWLRNRHLSAVDRLGAATSRPLTWNIGAENPLKDAYLAQTALACDFPQPADWPRSSSPPPIPRYVRDAMDEALDRTTATIPDIQLSSTERRGLIDLWGVRLSELRAIYDAALQYQRSPDTLLWGSQGNSTFRAVVHALRRRGTRIVGFQHGHNPVWVHHPYMAFNEVRGCDEFVCGTPGQAAAYQRMIARSGISETSGTKISSADIPLYDQWRMSRRSRSGVRRILLPGFPGLSRVYSYDWTGFSLMRTPLEVRVAGILRQAGYEVVYKPHPESASLMATVMQPHVDRVALGSFEDAVGSVDAAVYLYPFSTTLPYVLLHNLPVLLIDVAGRDWLPDVLEALKKRCAVVTGSLGPDNRILLDDRQVLDGMELAKTLEDDSFASSFYSLAPHHAQ